MSVMLYTGAAFVKKNSCLVARIVSFNTAGLHLLTCHFVEPYPSKDLNLISVMLSHINDAIISSLHLSLIWINASKFSSCQNMMIYIYIYNKIYM